MSVKRNYDILAPTIFCDRQAGFALAAI